MCVLYILWGLQGSKLQGWMILSGCVIDSYGEKEQGKAACNASGASPDLGIGPLIRGESYQINGSGLNRLIGCQKTKTHRDLE